MAEGFSLDELMDLDPFKPFVAKPEGVYYGQFTDAEGEDYSEKSYKYVIKILEGEFKGSEQWIFRAKSMPTDPDKLQVAKRSMLTDLLAIGHTKEKLKGKNYNPLTVFKNKKCHFHFIPGDPHSPVAAEKNDKVRLLLPESVEEMKARYSDSATATGAQRSAPAAAGKSNGASQKIEQPAAENLDDL